MVLYFRGEGVTAFQGATFDDIVKPQIDLMVNCKWCSLHVALKINMDKSWINIRIRLDPLYEKGADDFVEFASKDRPNATEILCPCMKCRNMKFMKKVDVAEHIVVDGFLSSYTHWIFHGESSLT
ncbi:hypothetical protein RJ639_029878 [Escallonia herrerae]|uniref:Transposase-associated domain-containing protein n=1 Tax=Escallonia herrerae TaxID=1293975 RepID=A0AA88X9Y3_9ASTE|nr:hypothetical protein RJ639_029878 [Escallonia herrerae]